MATNSTVLSVIMGALQIIGLFLPVVILTTRFVVRELEPSEGASPTEIEDKRERQRRLARFNVILIIVLSGSAVTMIISLLLIFGLPWLVLFGLSLLAAAFLGFGVALRDAIGGTNRIL